MLSDAAAYLADQCMYDPLYDVQCTGYQQAYFDQQCELDSQYDQSCPNYLDPEIASLGTVDPVEEILSEPDVPVVAELDFTGTGSDTGGEVDVPGGLIGRAVSDSFTLNNVNQPHYGLRLGVGSTVPVGMSGYYGIAFASNGSEKVRITKTGRLGIGITNPDGNLHVHNSSAGSVTAAGDANELVLESAANVGMSFLTANDALSRIKFGDPDATNAGIIAYSHADDSFQFKHTSNERLRIKSDGDIGINNASPSAKLDVVDDGASGYIAEFRQSNTSNSGQIIIDSPTDGDSRPVLIDMARAGTVKWSIGQGYNSSGGAFHISNGTLQSGVSNVKVTINTDGDMGVGTGGNDPTQRLDVRESNSSTFNATSNLPTQIRAYNTSSTNGACAGIQIRTDNNAGAAGIQYIHAVNSSTAYDSDLVFSRRIASSGNYAETARFTNAGNLKFPSSKGIDFSATSDGPSMGSELFDDYEEGSWTPFVGTQSGTNYTLGTTYNCYTKIGNIVHAHFKYQFTAEGDGTITIFNLPFTADANVDLVGQGYVTSGSNRKSIQYTKYTTTLVLPRLDDGTQFINYWTSRGSWAPTNTFVMHITYKAA